jgi:1-acyl-sn-glycerol-3-phosphate acyltransferase
MRIAMFLVSLLVNLLAWEAMLRARLRIAPRGAFAYLSRFQRAAACRILALARASCGFRLHVSRFPGRLPRQCLVVANHQSLVDIPVLMRAFPALDLRFVAKRELRRGVPAVSLTLRAGKHALIGRQTRFAQAERELRNLAALTKRGVSPTVFPEGTRTKTGEVGRFHPAAVRILSEVSGLPILSVAVDGGYRISGLKKIVRNLVGASFRVAPLSLYPAPRTRQELASALDAARSEIIARVRRWREEAGRSTGA